MKDIKDRIIEKHNEWKALLSVYSDLNSRGRLITKRRIKIIESELIFLESQLAEINKATMKDLTDSDEAKEMGAPFDEPGHASG